jgi:hypothetical protein
LVLFGENTIIFSRVAGLGLVTGLVLFATERNRVLANLAWCGSLVCAVALAEATSRAAVLGAVLAAVCVGILLYWVRPTNPLASRGIRLAGTTFAMAFLIVVSLTYRPTASRVDTLTELPNNVSAVIAVPLVSGTPRPTVRPFTDTPSQPTTATAPTASVPVDGYQYDLSISYRIERYRAALQQFTERPVFGWGYTYGTLTREGRSYAHNIFLEVAAELGVLGLVALALILGGVVRAAYRSDRGLVAIGVLALLASSFVEAQTSGNLTINRLLLILCVATIVVLTRHAKIGTTIRPGVAGP